MGGRARSWKSLEKREFKLALVSVLVPFTLFFIVVYFPQLTNLFFSFTNWDGYSREFRMVGLANFRKFFTYQPILSAMGNTFLFTGCVTVLGAATQLGMALILSRGLRGSSFYKAAFYLPLLFSWVVLAIIWNSILRNNGLLNSFLRTAGLAVLARDWLSAPGRAMGSLIFINTWCGFGYGLIIFLAGINSIPPEVREAAAIDGATGIKEFRYVTLPLIMYSLTIDLFLGIGTLNIFDLIFVMTGGGPAGATRTVALAIYEEAFRYERVGFACASSLVFMVIVGVLSFLQVRITRSLEVQY